MIVRIATEGQYELGPDDSSELERLESQTLSASQEGDEARFREAFTRVLGLVRARGRRLPDDELIGSDVILPPPDVSLAEAQAEFTGEGLIPG